MRSPLLPCLGLLLLLVPACEMPMTGGSSDWRARMMKTMPLLGHRNWIVVADSAFPMVTGSGVQTVYIGGDQLTAVATVLSMVDQSKHLRPIVTLDAELTHVSEADAEGIDDYRQKLDAMLATREVRRAPHEEVIRKIEETSKSFRVVLLKTNMALPYTTVFVELDCGYWTPEAESKLRAELGNANQRDGGSDG